MKLSDYIEWTRHINDYDISPQVANPDTWDFKVLDKIELPKQLNFENAIQGDEGYSSIRNDSITNWARDKWPHLQCLDAKIQIQKPGEECKPHLDFLGDYLEKVCQTMPGIKCRALIPCTWSRCVAHVYCNRGSGRRTNIFHQQ